MKDINYEISWEEFNKITDGISLVEFYTPNCQYCRALSSEIEKSNIECPTYKIDATQNPELAGEFGIMSVPNTHVFKNGKSVFNHIGIIPVERLKKEINNA